MRRRRCTRCHTRPARKGHCAWCRRREKRSRPPYADLPAERRRRQIARSYAGVYFRRGKLKPKPCQLRRTSKTPCHGPIEKHHRDYSKPLDVVWGCRGHHREEHAEAA
jgi:hypothetical protein